MSESEKRLLRDVAPIERASTIYQYVAAPLVLLQMASTMALFNIDLYGPLSAVNLVFGGIHAAFFIRLNRSAHHPLTRWSCIGIFAISGLLASISMLLWVYFASLAPLQPLPLAMIGHI